MTKQKMLKIVTAAAAAVPMANFAYGCAAVGAAQKFIDGSRCKPGPVAYVVSDVSASTATLRVRGGLYEQGLDKVIVRTAEDCGELFAAPLLDGNAIGNRSGWTIDGRSFRNIAVGGNKQLSSAARGKLAKKELLPKVRTLLTTTQTNGSDALGAMQRVAMAAATEAKGRSKKLFMFFDGALNLPGRYSVYETPIDTAKRRAKFIARLRADSELPQLRGFDVYLIGLGVGISNRTTAKGVIALWQELIPLTGGRLVSTDVTPRFT
jgi:hypothetical protein